MHVIIRLVLTPKPTINSTLLKLRRAGVVILDVKKALDTLVTPTPWYSLLAPAPPSFAHSHLLLGLLDLFPPHPVQIFHHLSGLITQRHVGVERPAIDQGLVLLDLLSKLGVVRLRREGLELRRESERWACLRRQTCVSEEKATAKRKRQRVAVIRRHPVHTPSQFELRGRVYGISTSASYVTSLLLTPRSPIAPRFAIRKG